MVSAWPGTLPDSIRLNAPPLRSLLHFSSRSPSPEQSRYTHLHPPAVHSTRISHRHHCGRCDLYHVLFSSLLPSANSCHSFRLSLTFIHSLGSACPFLYSTTQFHPFGFDIALRSIRLPAPSQQRTSLFHSTRLGGATSLDFRRNPYAPLTSIPRRKLAPNSIFIPSDHSILVLCLADYFLTIITTSHRRRWTFTFDSIRPSKPSEVSIHKLYECSNQRIPKCPRHLHRPLRPPQLTVQHLADRRAKAPSLNSKRIKNDREPHRTNCLR